MKAATKKAAAKKMAKKAVPKTPKQAVKSAERAWSKFIKTGCAKDSDEAAKNEMKAFLEKTLYEDYTNIDHLGTVHTKEEDIANCFGGLYVVGDLTPPEMEVRPYGGRCVVVVGTDEVKDAKFTALDGATSNVSGKFIWTDTWVRFGKKWKCVASHGSKLPDAS